MTIKQASEQTGITIDNPRYDDTTLSWIDFSMRFKRGGMAMEAIREYVQLDYRVLKPVLLRCLTISI